MIFVATVQGHPQTSEMIAFRNVDTDNKSFLMN